MVTTRRSSEISTAYEPCATVSGVDLLERPETCEEVNVVEETTEAQERRKNLDKLLNYDRFTEQSSVVIEEETEQIIKETALSDEDIRPTSTTMQFGDDIDQIRREMNKANEEQKQSYSLNNKGKLVITLYALAVTVIMALIILNTGVLAKLTNSIEAKVAKLDDTIARYEAVQEEIGRISNSEYIIDYAQNELGMVKGN